MTKQSYYYEQQRNAEAESSHRMRAGVKEIDAVS